MVATVQRQPAADGMDPVKCHNCGCENPAEKAFCRQCGCTLAGSPVDAHTPNPDSQAAVDAVLADLSKKLELAAQAEARLQHRLALSEQNVASLKQQMEEAARKAEVTFPLENSQEATEKDGLIKGLQGQLRAAEEAGESLRIQFATKARQLEEAVASRITPGAIPSAKVRRSTLAGAVVVLAIVSVWGGYRKGLGAQNPLALQRQQSLIAKSLKDGHDLQDLRAQLAATQQTADKAQHAADQLANDLTAAKNELSAANGSTTQWQQKFNAKQAQLAQKIVEDRNRVQDIAALNQKNAQLNLQLVEKSNQAAALQQVVDQHPFLSYKGPREGVISLSGNFNKDKTILLTFENGKVTSSDSDLKWSLPAPLPGVPVVLQPRDESVLIHTSPSKETGWRTFKLRVDVKKGKMEPKIVGWKVVD
jgi:hypothetical protein